MTIIFVPEYRKDSDFEESIVKVVEKSTRDKCDVVYVTKDVNPLQQQQFLYAVHVADVVIVDCTNPYDINDGGVYPALTAQVNILNHVIVISENVLPLNITPYRGVYPTKDGEILSSGLIFRKLSEIIQQSLNEDTYKRLPEDSYKDFERYQPDMERMMQASLEARNREKLNKTSVMISYRNSYSKEVENFKKIIENVDNQHDAEREFMGINGNYEVKVLPPASLCGADEAHTPMRRWMLVGLLEDHIRSVDEVWIYLTEDYTWSWWTMAEIVMTAYINKDAATKKKIKVFDVKSNKLITTDQELPKWIAPYISKEPEMDGDRIKRDSQYQRLVRALSNTRPDTMGPECMEQIPQLRLLAEKLRKANFLTRKMMKVNIRSTFERSIPITLPEEDRRKMIEDSVRMYTDPYEIERYISDDVFMEEFWNQISYQTSPATECFNGKVIDIDKFLSIPMDEVTALTISDFEIAAKSPDGIIKLGVCKLKVSKASYDRYLWLATRMGKPTRKEGNAPGLERIPIYNLSKL